MIYNIREVVFSDLSYLLEINNNEVPHVNFLTFRELEYMAKICYALLVAEYDKNLAAFILVFDHKTNYNSLNYKWFKIKYKEFIYVDRIVVNPDHRSNGIARRLYKEVENLAKEKFEILTCEVNLSPPNPVSMAFHKNIGFCEVGTQTISQGKEVAMLAKTI